MAGKASVGTTQLADVTENLMEDVSNDPVMVPGASGKNIWVVHVDNRDNADPTFIKLWNEDTVTYSTDEPDIKIKVPGGAQGAVRVGYSAASEQAITPDAEEWWVAASSESAIDGDAPNNTVTVRVTRDV